jgi:hypothetical protein
MVEKQHVNELFSRRDDKREFEMLFQELWDQPEKFFEYFRMKPETFKYKLEKIEESITKFTHVPQTPILIHETD